MNVNCLPRLLCQVWPRSSTEFTSGSVAVRKIPICQLVRNIPLFFHIQVLSLLQTDPVALLGFWHLALKGRKFTKRIVDSCWECKKRRARPRLPIMGPLPKVRLIEAVTFQNTGRSYFGPLFTKRDKVREKRRGCLITCLTTCQYTLKWLGQWPLYK